MSDLVSDAFHTIQKEASRRGLAPKSQQITRAASKQESNLNSPADAGSKASGGRRKGIPTGPDGRRLPKKDNLESVNAVLQREISRRGWGREIAGGWVQNNWEELVGAQVAAHTKVEMFKGEALFISCDSTAWATNLRMMQRNILAAIARQVGQGIITELKIFGPKTPSWRHGPLHVKGRGPRDTYG
ncbi:DciA family protein [Corynebacterium sp. 153RC1]|uniref:DciA family protein n=1 Tax=unclassified Corynebacterium TaxID=2624378 RepID=UPI00211C29B0|nr:MULTISPECIES: DciA family protein [unclassified Corynebacterium]MCQ9352751.1 DciA family protein [Corynebacterium sp. 209RC1]MCQ9354935.1 DciA family protein [Corynebacterium sp. 1222RC1]MCQ9357196.1 DciA family protein [Corynebacterium sp. 122RC1]MCQ9359371.1 DciA family protein [Corynebacterium sp. 142RC1]MCQ9361593.1 DciA family protein [Corynebacterium sp. 153RC1]